MLRTGRYDQIIEADPAAFCDDLPARDVDTGDLGQNHLGIVLLAEDSADRRCDVCRRQAGGRNLIEQRLEHVIVVLIYQRDVEWLVGERLGG